MSHGPMIRALLRLYPQQLREEHGAEMEDALHKRVGSIEGAPVVRFLRRIRFVFRDAWTARRLQTPPLQPDRKPDPGGRWGSALDVLRVDGRYALRRLIKSPVFTLVAALSLGLGIGANSAVFSIVNAVLFRTFPADDPETLVDVFMSDDGGMQYATMSYLDFTDLGAQADVFEEVIAARTFFAQAGPIDAPRLVIGELVSGNYFPVLGTQPAAGRMFNVDDDLRPGEHQVAVLSHAFWQEAYGGAMSAVGSEVRVNQRPYTVIGVAPESFTGSFPIMRADLWVPLNMTDAVLGPSSAGQLERRSSRSMFAKARLREGVTPAQANEAVVVLSRNWEEAFPETNKNRILSVLPTQNVSINPAVDRFLAPAAVLLLTVVGLVLLVACTNLASFLLARAAQRKQEIAVRLALGATRANLIRQLLIESTLLGVLGGLVGLVLASWTVDLIVSFQPPLPIPINLDIGVDGRVLAWTGLISIGAGLLFGLAPALQASNPDLVPALKSGAQDRLGRRMSLRDVLVIAQVSLSIVLLVGAGLFLKSLTAAQQTDPGFYTGPAALAWPNFELSGYTEDEGRAAQEQIVERLAGLPIVTGVALADRIPLGVAIQTMRVEVPGVLPEANRDDFDIDFAYASPSYFDVLDVPIVEGRAYSEIDGPDTSPVVVVSEAFSRRFWPEGGAVGRLITVSGLEREVIGVARDTKVRTLGESPRAYAYLPSNQGQTRVLGLQIIVRGSTSSAELLAATRRVLAEMDSDLVIMETKTMEEHLALLLFPPRMAALLLSVFGGLALLLAGVGLYGIVSFAVSRRTQEVGIRVSLGATSQKVTALLVSGGMKLVGIGTALGLIAALGASALLTRFLFGAEALDVPTFLGVPVLLATVALFAAYLPARRAGRINPVDALRGD